MPNSKNSDNLETDMRELEELEVEEEENKDSSENILDVDLSDLEKQINDMDDGLSDENNENKAKPREKPLEEFEAEFHGVELMFGNVLDEEVNKVIPGLKKKYAADDYLDYHIALNKKEQDLIKFKALIGKRVNEGLIDEKKYLDILSKITEKNKDILAKAEEQQLDQSHIKRISARMSGLESEIKEVKETIIANDTQDKETEETPQTGASNDKTEEPKQHEAKKPNNARNITPEKVPEGTKESAASLKDKEEQHARLVHFAKKITAYLKGQAYLKKYLEQERPDDLARMNEIIDEMKAKLEQLKKEGCKETIEELDQQYPDLDPELIIGSTRDERNREIDQIFTDVKADLQSLKDNQLVQLYNKHYIDVLKYLKEVKASTYGIMPKMHKKTVSIPYKEINANVPKGVLEVTLNKIDHITPGTNYYVVYSFAYDDAEYSETTPYCSHNGVFNYHKRFHLDSGKLSRSFYRNTITFTLYKRKFFITSKYIAECNYSLSKLANFCTSNLSLEFPYKDEKTLVVDGTIKINMALSKPMKELELYTIDKKYPIFTVTELENVPKQQSIPETKGPGSNDKDKTDGNNKPENKPIEFKSEFKYPVITAAQKKWLAAIVTKMKMPSSYLDFQDKVLNVTYLEEFKDEIEKQIDKFAKNEDYESVKETQSMMLNATKFYNFLVNKLQNGEMSMAEYKKRVDAFVLQDEKYLPFFESIKLENAVVLVTNRLEVMKNEQKQLEQQLAEMED